MPDLPAVLQVVPLADPLTEYHGHHVTSPYVATFWTPVLGPSSMLVLLRLDRLARDRFTEGPCDAARLAASVGLGVPYLWRAIERLDKFGATRLEGSSVAARSHLAPLPAKRVRDLPRWLRDLHQHVAVDTFWALWPEYVTASVPEPALT